MKKLFISTALFLTCALASADGPRMGAVPAIVKQECAACHTVYPPAFLPRQSWKNILAGLDKHYGVDASLDAKTLQSVTEWIMLDAGTYKRVAAAPAEDRITKSAWFVRKHSEVGKTVWTRASIKSAANCIACHGGADIGNYGENDIRIPK